MSILDKFRLDGQVAVVTGAGKGIGRAIAIGLAEAGADVAIGARTAADLDEVAQQIRARGRRALALPTDATSMAALEALAARAAQELGPISIWVSNAGGIPGGRVAVGMLLAPPWRRGMLSLLSRVDRRPGRLHTFVARRPAANP